MFDLSALWEFVFPTPRICVLCETELDAIGLCAACREYYSLYRLREGQCQRCHSYGQRGKSCSRCRHWPAYLTRVNVLWPYEKKVRETIAAYKYRGESWRAIGLAPLMTPLVPQETNLIVPVPLHQRRLEERGYNQSEILAKKLARITGLPYLPALKRIRHTPHQVGLSRSSRFDNVQSAFIVRKEAAVRQKAILLIDDVITSGATIETCAKALYQAGASSISVAVLASGFS